MFSKAVSATIVGIEGIMIQVEADVTNGLPMFQMVGYLASEVKEAKERVRIAIKNAGFFLEPKKITVNLSPANIRKEGTAFDFPIAIAILASFGYIPNQFLEHTVFAGELSLNGEVEKVNGILSIVHAAKAAGMTRCLVPKKNALEGAVVPDIDVIGISNLKEAVSYLNQESFLEPTYLDVNAQLECSNQLSQLDFSDVVGQEAAKRAIEIAVSGQHNLLLSGPPGTGKTMLAKRIPTIMPDMSFEESLEISKIYSISGLLDLEKGLIAKRPFRAPHHTITPTALTGGGRIPRPGEISLANGGVLFLDELPEYNKGTLEVLRQPLEDRLVNISRLHGTYRFPARFMLVAAMNPCKCGYYPDRNKCQCTEHEVKKYISKLSRPLLDRIDLVIETQPVDYASLQNRKTNITSDQIRKRVEQARNIQKERYKGIGIEFNAQLSPTKLKKYCVMTEEGRVLLQEVYQKLQLSARAFHRIIKVSRTIADLAGSEVIQKEHVSEAICYRVMDQLYYN